MVTGFHKSFDCSLYCDFRHYLHHNLHHNFGCSFLLNVHTGAYLIPTLVCCSTTALLTLQHPPKAPPLPESDSECYTDPKTGFSESDDDLHSDEDLNKGVSLEQEEVQDADAGRTQDMPIEIRQVEVQDAPVGTRFGQAKVPIRFRRGLRSQITLGEEITQEIYGMVQDACRFIPFQW